MQPSGLLVKWLLFADFNSGVNSSHVISSLRQDLLQTSIDNLYSSCRERHALEMRPSDRRAGI